MALVDSSTRTPFRSAGFVTRPIWRPPRCTDRIGGNASLISLTTTLGVFAGSLIFGPLGAAYGYQVPLIISGAISLALLPLAYAGLKEGA